VIAAVMLGGLSDEAKGRESEEERDGGELHGDRVHRACGGMVVY
jgi:hypothetical protein